MTNTERTKNLIKYINDCLIESPENSSVRIRDAALMDIAVSLADIADSLTVIKEKLTEESK